jgi:hypothetical protein
MVFENLSFDDSQVALIRSSVNPYVEWLIQATISDIRTRLSCPTVKPSSPPKPTPEVVPLPEPEIDEFPDPDEVDIFTLFDD